MPDRLTAWIKVGLLAIIPVYLIGDLIVGYVQKDNRRVAREELCFRFEDEIAEIERQKKLPVTIVGKFDHFIRCGSIKEISLLGGKISNERVIARKKEETEENQRTAVLLAKAEEQINDLATQLASTGESAPDISRLTNDLEMARTNLRSEISAQEAKINQLETLATLPNPAGQWLLVVGADQTDRAAIDQVERTRAIIDKELGDDLKARTGGVELRLVRSWRRTVVVFETREAANAVFVALADELPYGGYVRAQLAWCPDLTPVDPIGGVRTMRCES